MNVTTRKTIISLSVLAAIGLAVGMNGATGSEEAAPTPLAAAAKVRLRVKEALLAKFPENVISGCMFVSSDNGHVAWIARKIDRASHKIESGKSLAVVDGVAGKEYDRVWTVVFSPDGSRVGYWATRGNKWLVVIDGVEGKEYSHVVPPIFSLDNRRVAYAAQAGGKAFAVIDGIESKPYDWWIQDLVFSPDSKHVAYGAKRGDKWIVVVDGVEGKGYDGLQDLAFSPDSRRIAYSVCASTVKASWVVVDPVPGEKMEGAEQAAPAVERKEYDAIGHLTPLFSPDGKRIAYRAERGKQCFAVVDNIEGKAYAETGRLVFSPDSKRLGYAAKSGDKWFVVVDGVEGRPYVKMGEMCPVFSPDGKRATYAAERDGKWLVVIDGMEGNAYDEVRDGSLVFNSDSKHFAYSARRGGRWIAVCDQVEGAEFHYTTLPAFSPDGKHLAYVGEREGKYFMVVDGSEALEYGGTIDSWHISFDGPSSFHVVGSKDRGYYRVAVEIEGK